MLVICKQCEKQFEKSVNQINKTNNNNFCCRSCSATYNNLKYPKRSKTKKCKYCTNLVSSKLQKCKTCINNFRKILDSDRISDVTYRNHHKSSSFALIRSRARTFAKTLNWNCCKYCGYDKHIEICHIKPIKDFSEDSLVSEVNHIDNLLPLCPNCHWEFDNNLINLNDINK